jgi:hypothetical protein
MDIPTNADARLTRQEVAAALTAAGFPIAWTTLATKATRGGGPTFTKFNGRVLYRWADALAWAKAQTTAPRASTSEAETRRECEAA